MEDYEPYCAMTSDPAFRLVPAPKNTGEAWNHLLRNLGHWSTFGFGLFAVINKGSGSFLGETGFLRSRPGSDFPFDNSPVAAWVVTRSAQGRGIALEAASAAHGWLTEVMYLKRTVCMIHPWNQPSIRIAAKLGYQPIGECSYKGELVTTFERRTTSGHD